MRLCYWGHILNFNLSQLHYINTSQIHRVPGSFWVLLSKLVMMVGLDEAQTKNTSLDFLYCSLTLIGGCRHPASIPYKMN